MEHDARSVGNELIRRAWDSSQTVTHLKIMKLVYFCQGWMLGIHHEPLFWQPVEAWKYGPVVRDVYRSLRRYGGEPIRHLISLPSEEYTPTQEGLIEKVWAAYGKYSALELSAKTHAPGTPWHQTWERWGRSATIPVSLIEDYYARAAREPNR